MFLCLPSVLGVDLVVLVWLFYISILMGDLGRLVPSSCLCFPVPCVVLRSEHGVGGIFVQVCGEEV